MLVLRIAFKFLVSIFAVILIFAGIVLTPAPAPFGIIFIFIGFFLLAAVSPDLMRWLRRRWGWLDRQLIKLERKLPRWLARQLRKSEIDKDEKEQAPA